MFHGCHITAIIPALDEEQAIPDVIRSLTNLSCGNVPVIDRIVVCDNGSRDATAAVAASLGADVVQEPKRGYGAACLKALSVVSATDIVLFLSADGSEIVAESRRLLEPICRQSAELVIGARVPARRQKHALSRQQVFGNWLAAYLIRILWKVPVTDLGPFRAIRYDTLRSLDMRDRNYGWTVEMQIKSIRQKKKVMEIPVSALQGKTPSRISGTLSGTVKTAWKIIGLIVLYGFLDRIAAGGSLGQNAAVSGTDLNTRRIR